MGRCSSRSVITSCNFYTTLKDTTILVGHSALHRKAIGTQILSHMFPLRDWH
jgi:hypothetical protein